MGIGEIEANLILSCLKYDKIYSLKTRGLDASRFAVWGDVLEFIYNFQSKYQCPPALETLSFTYPDFPLQSANSYDIDYLIDIVSEDFKKRKLREIIDDTIDRLDEGVEKAIEHFRMKSSTLGVKEGLETYLDNDSSSKVDEYIRRNKSLITGEQSGLRTGISVLDKELLGWSPGDFVLLVGPPEVGKSWVLMRTCVVSYINGKRILYISPEMPANEVLLRFHTVLGREYGYSFSNESLMVGKGIDVDEYQSFLDRIGDKKNWRIVDNESTITVSKIEGWINEFRPHLVAIDPLPLLTSSDGSLAVSWTAILEVAYALKFLATRTGVVIITTSVSTGDTFGRRTPAEASELGLGRYILYAADLAMSISTTIDPKVKIVRIIKKRKGKGVSEPFMLTFDPDIGRIEA